MTSHEELRKEFDEWRDRYYLSRAQHPDLLTVFDWFISKLDPLEAENAKLREWIDAKNKALDAEAEHTCHIDGADFGWRPCCNVRDYIDHKVDCPLKAALALGKKT